MTPKTKRRLKWRATQFQCERGFIWKAVGVDNQWNSCITRNGRDSKAGHITKFDHKSKLAAMDWVEKHAKKKGTK